MRLTRRGDRSRRPRIVLGVVALAAALAACKLPAVYHGRSGLDPARDPDADLREALAAARESGRRVVVYAGGDWCPWCHAWDEFKAEHPAFRDLLERNFVVVPVHYGPGQMNEAFFVRFPPFTTAPQFIFLTADGDYLHHQDLSCCETPEGGYDEVAVEQAFERWANAPPPGDWP